MSRKARRHEGKKETLFVREWGEGDKMIIGVPKEIKTAEKRVAVTPQGVDALISHHQYHFPL